MIGHMEAGVDEPALEEGRLRVAIAFADLAGYARLTVEQGDAAAVSTVERFVEAVGQTLPGDARVIKTLGDEVMVHRLRRGRADRVAVDLTLATGPDEPLPRIGVPTARRSTTGTATTTAATSTRRRAWWRGRGAARCS